MTARSTFDEGVSAWLDSQERVRNVVRQEVISRYLARHVDDPAGSVLDVGAGQGIQTLRLARAGCSVVAVEPDPVMRARLVAALEDEPADVRRRVEVVADGIDDLPHAVGTRASFHLVLLLGVLMYLPEVGPVVERIAQQVRPGGVAAVAFRTVTSAVWRPAARQDWTATLAAFDERDLATHEGRDVRYVNELGVPARAVELSTLAAEFARHGLELEQWYGVRVAVDMAELDPLAPTDPEQLAALVDVEERLGRSEPFRHLGQLALAVFRAPPADPSGG